MRFWKRSLMARLVVSFLGLSVLITSLVGVLAYNQARDILEQLVYERLVTVAFLKEEDIKQWIAGQQEDVGFVISQSELRLLAEELIEADRLVDMEPGLNPREELVVQRQQAYDEFAAYLAELSRHKSSWQEILLLSAEGKIVASTVPERERDYRDNDAFFTEGRQALQVINVYPSPMTGKQTMTVSGPLLNRAYETVGVFAVHLNLERMDQTLLDRTGLGETGETYLVDQYFTPVSGERFSREFYPQGLNTEGIRRAIEAKTNVAGLFHNYENVSVIGVYHWIDDLELVLIAEMHQQEAFAPARRLATTIFIAGVVAAVILGAGIYLLAQRIARPLQSITQAAMKVTEGDFSVAAPVAGQDEVGVLARAFNRMTAELRALYAGLNQKVAELEKAEATLQRYAGRLEAQHEIDRAILKAQSAEEIAEAALDHLLRLVPCQYLGVITFDLDNERATLLAEEPYAGPAHQRQIPLEQYARLIQQQRRTPYITSYPAADIPLSEQSRRAGRLDLKTLMIAPLVWRQETIGILVTGKASKTSFTPEQIEIAREVTDQLAVAIRQAQLFSRAQQEIRERKRVERALRQTRDELEVRVAERTAELTLLNRASQALISTLELDQVLSAILEELRKLLNVAACSVWLVNQNNGEIVCRQSSGPDGDQARGWRLSPGEGIVGWVARHGQSVILADAQKDPRHHTELGQKVGLTTRSLLTVPLVVKGEIIGALQALDAKPNNFSQSDLAVMDSLAATAAIAIENARLYDQARQDSKTKSILLSEVNHRVKNNLSAIIGLLYTERRHAGLKDQTAYQIIMEDLINRVEGLATVHTLLSAHQWSPLSLTELATNIVHSSLRALPPDKRLAVHVTPSDVHVAPNQASNLALIINELATNSIKYALKDRNKGQIEIAITRQNDVITLVYADDGPGYPDNILKNATSAEFNVGFHLMHNILKHTLNGKLALSNRQDEDDSLSGAVTTIWFKLETDGVAPLEALNANGDRE